MHGVDCLYSHMKNKIGVAIGSGGVYSAAGLGVLQQLEEEGVKIEYVAGASAGAIVAALYFLEGDAKKAEKKLLKKLPKLQTLKLSPWKKPVPGEVVKKIIEDLLDGRDWKDGKLKSICFAAKYEDTKETLVLNSNSGLSLIDCVLASISLKMIEPIVKLNGRLIAHGGDPEYVKEVRNMGANFVIEVSPNLQSGVVGKAAKIANELSSAAILKGDYLSSKKKMSKKAHADLGIHPGVRLIPFVSLLNFNSRNIAYTIQKGYKLMENEIETLNKETNL